MSNHVSKRDPDYDGLRRGLSDHVRRQLKAHKDIRARLHGDVINIRSRQSDLYARLSIDGGQVDLTAHGWCDQLLSPAQTFELADPAFFDQLDAALAEIPEQLKEDPDVVSFLALLEDE